MAPRETIVLLGTGMMGAAMGRNLLRAGFPVRAWNRTSAKVAPLAEEGALAAASPAEAVSGAGIVLTMLADGEAIEATMAGPSGALAALGDGAVWVQSSTVGVDDTERLAAMAGQRGIQFVDAPVLGTRQPAEKGELTVLASRTLWLGEAGAGTRLKLVVNTWILGLVGALASTIALARTLGVAPEQFLGTIEGSPMGTAYARTKGNLMAAGEYPTSFSLTLADKDVRLAMAAAAAGGADLPLLRVVDDLCREAIERGLGDADMAAIYEATRPGS